MSEYSCDVCKDEYNIVKNGRETACQSCCPHGEYDHYMCMDCGYEKCPGEDIDAAEYAYSDR